MCHLLLLRWTRPWEYSPSPRASRWDSLLLSNCYSFRRKLRTGGSSSWITLGRPPLLLGAWSALGVPWIVIHKTPSHPLSSPPILSPPLPPLLPSLPSPSPSTPRLRTDIYSKQIENHSTAKPWTEQETLLLLEVHITHTHTIFPLHSPPLLPFLSPPFPPLPLLLGS